jgi:HAD superfamily hydrolase (TIGR01509 family)
VHAAVLNAFPMRFVAPTREYAGYIFDCDGTLIESMPLHFHAWRTALQNYGASFEFSWELFVSRAGMPLGETVAALNLQFSTALDPALVVELQRATFRSLLTQVTAIEPVVAFARAMALRAPVGVASGGHRQEVEASLRNVGLDGVFRTIVTGDDVLRGKPDPEIFLRCAEGLGVPASECLVIEDGEFGIEAARRAGMPWVRVEAYAMSESLGAS